MKRILTPLAAACLLACAATPLQASSPYSSLIVFGDSLSDAGQFADPGSNAPVGATRRFTNRTGPTYLSSSGEEFALNATQLLSLRLGMGNLTGSTSPVNQSLGLPDGTNYAVGGNTTSQITDSIVGSGEGSVVELTDGTNLRQRPGYLAELASLGLRVDPNTLFYVNGGGNDFLDGLINPLAAPSLATQQAQQSATNLVVGIRALDAAGARYIMVSLLPDVGRTPFATNLGNFIPSLPGTISGLVGDFNQELIRQLQTIDAEIIPLNVPLMVREVLENPGRYGLATDLTTAQLIGTCFDGCANENAVYGINGTNPDPTKLLFNDGVHPTIAGQTLFADYAYSLLAAPWEASLLPEMAHGALRAHQDQLRTQWQADWEAWQAVGQWRSFVSAGGQRQTYDIYESDADGNGYNLNFGGSYRLKEAWRVGLAAGFYEQGLEAGEADSDYNLRSYLASAFAQYQQDRWWGEAAASIGYLDYHDLERRFDLGPATRNEKADTDGDLWSLSARLGYDIAPSADSPWHLSPFVSADYARVEVDGYAEDSNSSAALSYGDQKRSSKRLGLGFQGLYDLSQQTRLFGEVAVEREYEDDASEVDMAQRSLPTLGYTLQGYAPDDRTWRASLGLSHQLAPGLALRGVYSYRYADDNDQQGINLSLSWDL
ncbi:autotransporter domain-containing protein [Pseudomonas sp. CAU 1711]|uniref:autotransporter domain-containing protein n=1 Tax=Pseudomonas sp. CAU 1711 TaxID=3140356 RepID=UPI0032604FA6